MNFQVPQFIEIEDKIFGPLTLKQFLYIVGGVGLAFLFYVYLPIYLAVIPITAIVGLAGLLAFFKYNERPFINLMESAFRFSLTNKLYVWRKGKRVSSTPAGEAVATRVAKAPKLSESRLKDLSWSLDVKDIIR
ncbi:MAG: PrgI family protein [Candidatus Pacebacteria bacterium]|nr:PrgI family protein [Candidatus Paceibacterota bacterium]